MTEDDPVYCPHCGTNSDDSTIRCNEEYKEFSIYSCYNCGKVHIRDVKPELLILARSHKPVDETAIRVEALCRYVMSQIAYEKCEQKIKDLQDNTTNRTVTKQEIRKEDELDAAFKRLEAMRAVMRADLHKRGEP
jgi:hypothetical protein